MPADSDNSFRIISFGRPVRFIAEVATLCFGEAIEILRPMDGASTVFRYGLLGRIDFQVS